MSQNPESPLAGAELAANLRLEGEWITAELAEVIKQIQHLRTIYVTALFVLSGWVLAKLLERPANTDPLATLNEPEIAVVISLLPIINLLFFLLLLQANAEMQSLAKYRIILGCKLGNGEQVWRWPEWRRTTYEPVAWAAIVNIAFGIVALLVAGLALLVSFTPLKAYANGAFLCLWIAGAVISAAILVGAIIIGISYLLSRNTPRRPPSWDSLASASCAGEAAAPRPSATDLVVTVVTAALLFSVIAHDILRDAAVPGEPEAKD